MKTMHRFLIALVVLGSAAVAAADTPEITALWRTGTLVASTAAYVTADVTGDGIADIVGCGPAGAPFALSKRPGASQYDAVWFGPVSDCTSIAAGDIDGDGIAEVATTTRSGYSSTVPTITTGRLAVFSTNSGGRALAIATFNAFSDTDSRVVVANVDADPQAEIVVTNTLATYVYNAATLALEWTATDRGGNAVAVGDLEGDGKPEIVVDGSVAHILDAFTQTEKWGYLGGFGSSIAVADIDADGKAEIVYRGDYGGTLGVFDADTFTTKWEINASGNGVAIADANGDGAPEVIAGSGQYYGDPIRGYRASDGALLWSLPIVGSGTTALTAGDVDGDGVVEVIWAGTDSSGGLYVSNVITKQVEWKSTTETGSFRSVVADLDGDGTLELVVATSDSFGYSGGTLRVFDLATHTLEAMFPNSAHAERYEQLAVGQLDSDPALEIAILGVSSYVGYIEVWDGVTHSLQWTSPGDYYAPQFLTDSLVVANIDSDPVDEIIVGTNDHRIVVLNGASSYLQFVSDPLNGSPYGMKLGDVNADGVRDLVVATYSHVYVFETAGWTIRTQFPLSSARYVGLAPEASMFFIAAEGILYAYSGVDFTLKWSCSGSIYGPLQWANIAGRARLVAYSGTASALLFLPANDGCVNKEQIPFANVWSIGNISFADIDGDGRQEMFLDRYNLLEIYATGYASEPRGDANGDTTVTDADIDALAQHFYGDLRGVSTAADVDGDDAITQRDLYYLINYRKAGGPAPF
ncbi:MAG TPA: FG-GAP-like repeat-containing protein [Thermoanaerobaculia bacterium]|nr:FG-GAP-like repeat-containing protein [Thermoanaerobaculia bacterium]